MLSLITQRLTAIGYTLNSETDTATINYLIEEVESDFLIACNIREVPVEMKHFLANRVVGEFLSVKRSNGTLDIETINFEVVKSVTMGDTSVSMGGASNADLFDAYIARLIDGWKGKVACYRKLRW